jgi:streptogramin lyase
MSSRFTLLAAPGYLPLRVRQIRRSRPDHLARERLGKQLQLEGLEDRCLLSGISSITEFSLPSGSSVRIGPDSITAGPDGNIWFTDPGVNAIGRINPSTDAISLFTIPTASAGPWGITTGPDGNIWFCETGANAIGMINPTTDAISSFALPSGSTGPRNITAGPDGNMWFSVFTSHQIGEINPTTHAISVFSLSPGWPGPNGLTAGPNGTVWFTYAEDGTVGDVNTKTHAITYFTVPGSSSAIAGLWGITLGPDGNVWFATQSDFVADINPTTDAVSDFATPVCCSAGMTAGPDGNLWFTEGNGSIASINPTTDAISDYSIPYASSAPGAIITGPDGNLWFIDPGTNEIGVATLTTSSLVVTQQPPASVTAGSVFGLTVTAESSSGSPITSFDGAVTVALANNPGGATLGGTLTATASNGVVTFSSLTLTAADAGYTLVVSGGGLGEGITGAITVTPAAASQVVITEQPPAKVTAGSGFGLTATIEDMYGNAETGDNTDVVSASLASNPGGTTLGGTLSATVSQGVANFSGLTLTKAAAGYTIGVSSTSPGSATSSDLTVTPAAATQVVITTEPPASVVVNASFSLIAAIEDAYGNVETSSSATVKVALDNNPGSAKLGGTLSVKASKGVATFSGLTLNKVGSGYTLELTSSGLTTAVTNAISVTKNSSDVMVSPTAETGPPDPELAALVLDSAGFLDSLGLKKHARAERIGRAGCHRWPDSYLK